MSGLVQLALFVSSYSPLFFIFALLGTFGDARTSIAFAILGAIGTFLTPIIFMVDRRSATNKLQVASANPRDSDVLAYVATYLVPFADFDADSWQKKFAIALFISMIGALYVRLQLFYVNPLLAICGYRIYSVTTPQGTPIVLMSRRRFIPADASLEAYRLSDYVWRE